MRAMGKFRWFFRWFFKIQMETSMGKWTYFHECERIFMEFSICIYIYYIYISGWWFGTFFTFHNIWDNPSHWLIFFKMAETTNQIWMTMNGYEWVWMDMNGNSPMVNLSFKPQTPDFFHQHFKDLTKRVSRIPAVNSRWKVAGLFQPIGKW